MNKQILFLTALLLFGSLSVATAQNITPLKKGTLYKETIGTDGLHKYSIDLKADQYFLGKVEQQGIDLKVTCYLPVRQAGLPKGEKIKEFDSPNGQYGDEFFSITSEVAGTYVIEVAPLDYNEKAGNYTIELLKVQAKPSTNEEKVDQLFAAWDRDDSPGASVAIVKGGKMIYAKGYGSANLEYDISNTSKTIFHIASISKQFTCFAVAMLANEGKLSLNDDIRKYLPEVPDFGKTITIRQLCHHTSGMRDQWNLLALAGWRLDDVITKEHVLKLVANQKDLNYEPGAEYLYCNTGFTLLGEIVSRISGQSFAEYCAANIFKPLGMDHTLFYDDHEKIVKNRAYSYSQNRDGYKKSVLSYANAGATSLFTTVEDLSKWAINFETMTVGNPLIMDQMHERGVLNSQDTINYALGQSIGTYKGLKMVQHGGADAGYRTFLARFPDQDFAVIVFSNLASFNPNQMAFDITDIYLEQQLSSTHSNKPIAEKTEASTSSEDTKTVVVAPEILKSYDGQYELQPGFIISITNDGEVLSGQATGQNKFPLMATAQNVFEAKAFGIKISFQKNDTNEVHQLTLFQGGREMVAPRAEAFDPTSVDLTTFTGKFYSEELQTFYTLLVNDGKLVARHQRHEDIELTPIKENLFSGNRWYFGQLEFVKDAAGIISGCKVSSGRVRNVKFEKQ